MELKLSKSLVKKLLELANGATIPASQFKGPLCEALLKDGCICSKSNKSVHEAPIIYFIRNILFTLRLPS